MAALSPASVTSSGNPPSDESRIGSPSVRRFVRRHAYALFATLVVVAMAGHTVNEIWASPDFWVHLAAVREFGTSLLDPGNPLIVGGASDPYLSPYTFVLGAFVRATGIDAVTVLAVAGLANLVLLLWALRRFVASVSTVEFAPLIALVFTLTAWGLGPWRWSGFFDLNSLGTVLPLSSTFASAVGLLTIAALCDWLRGGSRWHLVVVGAGGPLVLLCHPMTAVWVGLVGLAFVIGETQPDNMRRVLALVAVVGGSTLLVLGWPFYSIARALGRSHTFDASNAPMYRGVPLRTFLAVPGLVVLVMRFLERHRDPLALGALFNAVVYAVAFVFGHDAFGRVLPGIMLMAHVALAIWVAELIGRWESLARTMKYAVSLGFVAIVVVGVVGSAAGSVRVVPRAFLPAGFVDDERLASLVAPYDQLTGLIPRDAVVVASPRIALGVAASSGKVVAPPAPAPFVEDVARRREVTATVLSPKTSSNEFRRLVDRYDVGWIVVTPDQAQGLEVRVRAGTLRLEISTKYLQVFRVVRSSS